MMTLTPAIGLGDAIVNIDFASTKFSLRAAATVQDDLSNGGVMPPPWVMADAGVARRIDVTDRDRDLV